LSTACDVQLPRVPAIIELINIHREAIIFKRCRICAVRSTTGGDTQMQTLEGLRTVAALDARTAQHNLIDFSRKGETLALSSKLQRA
jgi:hypothetical protein